MATEILAPSATARSDRARPVRPDHIVPPPVRPAARPQRSLGGVVAELPTIDLDTLSEEGELLTRRDLKYLVDVADVPPFVATLADVADPKALQIDGRRIFTYESVYYDTPTLTSYLQAARRRPHRFKVRSRVYVDSGQAFLEVKTRDGRRRTVKTRMDLTGDGPRWGEELDPLAQSFVAGTLSRSVAEPDEVAWSLTPTLVTRYRRTTLFLPADGARVTIDTDLRAQDRHGSGLVVPGMAIIETKTMGRASSADRVLWRSGHRPTKVSKYATTLAALHPALPASKWRPALRRLSATPSPA